MKDKLMNNMQRFAKAMFIPVLILPIAGILIAFGNLFTNARLIETVPFLDNPVRVTCFNPDQPGTDILCRYRYRSC